MFRGVVRQLVRGCCCLSAALARGRDRRGARARAGCENEAVAKVKNISYHLYNKLVRSKFTNEISVGAGRRCPPPRDGGSRG